MIRECPIQCETPSGGVCSHHPGFVKRQIHVDHCRNPRKRYRQYWDDLYNGVPRPSKKSRVRKGPPGAGTHLKRLLAHFGLVGKKGCGCGGFARVMDRRGPNWCEENRGMILSRLRREAKKRKLPFIAPAAATLVRLAIQRARREIDVRP